MLEEIRMTLIGGGKRVDLHILEPDRCATLVNEDDALLIESVSAFSEEILESNPDGGRVEISPSNAAEILGAKGATTPVIPFDSATATQPDEKTAAAIKHVMSRGYSPEAAAKIVAEHGADAILEAPSDLESPDKGEEGHDTVSA
jgi:antitoxin component of RelBE/YafQ-DinJ toxin-antitoxin module